MNKWYLRNISGNYELFCYNDSFEDEAPMLILMKVLKSKYYNILFEDYSSDIMNGQFSKKAIINNITFLIYEEFFTVVFSSFDITNKNNANDIILEIANILNATFY